MYRARPSAVGAELQLAQGEAEGGTLGRPIIRILSRLSAGDTRRICAAPEGAWNSYNQSTQDSDALRPGLSLFRPPGSDPTPPRSLHPSICSTARPLA